MRYLVCIMTGMGVTIEYMQRMCLSIMLADIAKLQKAVARPGSCPEYHGILEQKDDAEFDWNLSLQGQLVAAFFYGYFITHIPGGIIADIFGGKHIMGGTVLLSSLCTALSPISARAGPYYLLGVRLLMGLIQGPLFPAVTTLIAHWAPPEERGLLNTITSAGVPLGLVFGNLLTGQILYLMKNWIWPFYIYAAWGVIWFIFWVFLVSPSPITHPFISDHECALIVDAQQGEASLPGGIPWKEMLLSKVFLVSTLANLGHESSLFFLAGELPIFLRNVVRLPITMNSIASGIPWVAMLIGNFFFGTLTNILTKKRIMKTIMVRRIFSLVALLVPAVLYMLAVYVGCDFIWITAVVSAGNFFMSATFCSVRASFIDFAPNYAGITMSIAASIAGATGFAIPSIVHALIGEGNRFQDWKLSFYLVNGFLALSVVPYFIFITTDVQPWNKGVRREVEPKSI